MTPPTVQETPGHPLPSTASPPIGSASRHTGRNTCREAALAYAQAGLSVLPTVKHTKNPACSSWKRFQTEIASAAELEQLFTHGDSLAVVTGAVSGQLELLDFDQRAILFEPWWQQVEEQAPGLVDRLLVESTQSGGKHVVYRCPEVVIPGNDKFAYRAVDVTDKVHAIPAEDGESAPTSASKRITVEVDGKTYTPRFINGRYVVVQVLIETRGEGGYFLAAPSPGYALEQGDYLNVPVITAEERTILVEVARSLNTWIEPSSVTGKTVKKVQTGQKHDRPGDDYNERCDFLKMLEDEGWTTSGTATSKDGSSIQKLRRPGKMDGTTASLIDRKVLYVFSTNAHPFEAGKGYAPFSVYALLRHEGDFEAAAAALAQQGYGNANSLPARAGKKRRALAPNTPPVRVLDVIADAPVDSQAVVPNGFRVELTAGVETLGYTQDGGEALRTVCAAPVFISQRLEERESGKEFLRVVWYRDGRWKQHLAPRQVIATSRDIMELAQYGLPFTSNEANFLVHYLSRYEHENFTLIPRTLVSSRLGWQLEQSCFLLGKSIITAEGVRGLGEQTSQRLPILYQPNDPGDAQLAEAFHPGGTYEAWITTILTLYAHSHPMVMLLASFVPPFLDILGCGNFIVDLAGTTSHGKTISLRAAASVWGDPSGTGRTLLYGWNATPIWIERVASLLNGLPMFLDDTKLAGTGKRTEQAAGVVSSTIYQVANGRGRGRGSLTGIQETGSSRTVLLSTGEQRAIDFTTGDGGTRARTVSLWGAPFGSGNKAQMVNAYDLGVRENFGHAGPKVVEWILKHRDDWSDWRQAYQELRRHFADRAGENKVVARLADALAAFQLVGMLVHAALPELKPTRPIRAILDEAWSSMKEGADEADRATAALRDTYSWCVSNAHKFWGREKTADGGDMLAPHDGWAGSWKAGSSWTTIDIIGSKLTALLIAQKYEAKAMISTWADRGWLHLPGGTVKGHQRQVRVHGEKVSVYSIRRDKIEAALGFEGA